jgi:pseudaminic acid cytidylyltransferase
MEAAIKSELFDEVMVSTDDKEIAAIAQNYGANIPFMRSEKNSDDFTTTANVLIEVLQDYERKIQKKYDIVCCIYPTAPFVTAEKLKNAFRMFHNSKAEALHSVVQYSYPPKEVLQLIRDIYHTVNLSLQIQDHRIFNLFSMMPDNFILCIDRL